MASNIITAACLVSNHHRCRGTVLSLTEAHGAPCESPCHARGDDRIERRLEAEHFGEVA